MLDEQVFFPESFSSPSVQPRVLSYPRFPAAAAECLAVCGFDSPEVLQGVVRREGLVAGLFPSWCLAVCRQRSPAALLAGLRERMAAPSDAEVPPEDLSWIG